MIIHPWFSVKKMSIFELVSPPPSDVFHQRGDPNDIRLGEVVKTHPTDYPAAQVVLLGFPQDEGVRRNKGRIGAKDAPDAIRRCLYKLVQIEGLKLFDLGNTRLQDTLEAHHLRHQMLVGQILRDGKTLLVLGGGNDTSYPDCAALAHESSAIAAINVDAHFDVRADSPRNSGTPYRQLLDEGLLEANYFSEFAYQPFANSPTYLHYLRAQGANLYSIQEVYEQGISRLIGTILDRAGERPFFWGLDMDVVRAGDAPGVSAPNPSGLSGQDLCLLAQLAGAHPASRIFEITEVNPQYDRDERTCRLAAAALWYFMQAYTQKGSA